MKDKSNFACKLLFQFRIVGNSKSNKRRHCEEKIFHLHGKSNKVALQKAKKLGKSQEHNYDNCFGEKVYYEFVGVLDLNRIGDWWEVGQVWEDDCIILNPSERRAKIVPTDNWLLSVSG